MVAAIAKSLRRKPQSPEIAEIHHVGLRRSSTTCATSQIQRRRSFRNALYETGSMPRTAKKSRKARRSFVWMTFMAPGPEQAIAWLGHINVAATSAVRALEHRTG
jgi:hypothetical protein